MKLMLTFTAFFLMIALSPADHVRHEVAITYRDIPVPRFDPELGWLQWIEVELSDCWVTNAYLVDNDNQYPVEASVQHSFPVQFVVPVSDTSWSMQSEFQVDRNFMVSLAANNGDGSEEQDGGTDEVESEQVSIYVSPLVVTNQAYLLGSVGEGVATYRLMNMGRSIETDDGVECKHLRSGFGGQLSVTYHYDPPESNAWTRVVLSNKVDQLFYDGTQFVGYTFGAVTQHVYSASGVTTNLGYDAITLISEDGISWDHFGQPPAGCIAMGHNEAGRWYALVRDSYYNGWSSTYMMNLASSDGANVWTDHGELFRGSFLVPVRGEFCAHDGNVIIKQFNGFGAGWHSGTPSHPAYLFNEQSSTWTNFPDGTRLSQFRSMGNALYAIHQTAAEFLTSGYEGVESLDGGQSWNPLFDLHPESPVAGLKGIYADRFFFSGPFSYFHMFNRLGERCPIEIPFVPHYLNSMVGFAYNGRHAVVLSGDTIYYSEDHMATWNVLLESGLTPKQVLHDGHRMIVHARAVDASVLLVLNSEEAPLVGGETVSVNHSHFSRTEVDRYQQTNDFEYLELYPSGPVPTWSQIEMSHDLENWTPYAMPTALDHPFIFNMSDATSTSLFFRVRELMSP